MNEETLKAISRADFDSNLIVRSNAGPTLDRVKLDNSDILICGHIGADLGQGIEALDRFLARGGTAVFFVSPDMSLPSAQRLYREGVIGAEPSELIDKRHTLSDLWPSDGVFSNAGLDVKERITLPVFDFEQSLAQAVGKSILLPRLSPDGRFVVFCLCDYGCFPVYRVDSESWHAFSSNGCWLVFSSKRDNDTFTRPWFSYIDSNGQAAKPFVLPQEDPAFHETHLKTFNTPEFITEPAKISQRKLARAVRSAQQIQANLPLTGASPKASPASPPTTAPNSAPLCISLRSGNQHPISGQPATGM